MYDYIIIGGGISGLYCSLKLIQYNVIMLEANNYLGGRIFTNKKPHYEIGAGRYNSNHVILSKLIKHYNLTPIKIEKQYDFIYNGEYTKNINNTFDKIIKEISLKPKTESMKNITFYDYTRKFLTKNEADALLYMFGYYSEFKTMNAYDGIDMINKQMKGQYFVLKEGFSELVKRMSVDLNYKLNHKVKHIEYNDGVYKVDQYFTKNIIFTIPPDNLKHFSILKPYTSIIKSVKSNELLRIYAIYDNKWFANMRSITTDSFIRHIIPINSKTGLIMISYVEGGDIEPYINANGKLKSNNIVMNKINKELRILFPDKEIQEPSYFKIHLWKYGDYAWLPGYDSKLIAQQIINPQSGLYICGEGYSHNQSWMEGALETSAIVLDILERDHK